MATSFSPFETELSALAAHAGWRVVQTELMPQNLGVAVLSRRVGSIDLDRFEYTFTSREQFLRAFAVHMKMLSTC